MNKFVFNAKPRILKNIQGLPWGRCGVAMGSLWGRYEVAMGSLWVRTRIDDLPGLVRMGSVREGMEYR